MAEQATQAFQAIVGIVGICGNGLVCVVIAKNRFMHTLTNAFIFNQALIDLIGSLMTLLLNLVPIPDPIPPGAAWVFLCSVWISDYLQWAPFTASTFNLITLTLERYLAIVFPFRYQALATRKKAIAVLVGVWVAGFLFSSFGIYLRFYEAGEPGESLMRARRNTFKTLLIVCAAFIICWTPNQIFFFLSNLGLKVDFSSPIFYITIGMVALNSCLNPFIYAIKYKQFQKGLKVVFGKRGDRASIATASTGHN
ncbi:beta-1 adrenergic receptor-like [Patiria miniata]|uniref:G-protein coupled receptors family 1 profile domain-containing protein n=1 Tax=Patiria miniata TaxID=46514 RepID=A0A913Z7C6_PATMI|nr:beta-1 adrenergic receptor-like [Patiria miniata]